MPRARRAADEAGAKSTQLKFRATQHLSELIEEAAKRSGRNASEEIRQRLEQTFFSFDPKTNELAGAVARMATILQLNYGLWHSNRFSFEALKTAIEIIMIQYRPDGEPIPMPNPIGFLPHIYPDDVKPTEIARAIASQTIKVEDKP